MKQRDCRQFQRGTALLEFCLIFPLLVIFAAFLINIAIFVWEMVLLTDAARYGARKGVTYCAKTSSPYFGPKEVAESAANLYLIHPNQSSSTSNPLPVHSFTNWGREETRKFSAATNLEEMRFAISGMPFQVPVGILDVQIPVKAEPCVFCLKHNALLSFQFRLPEAYAVHATAVTFPACSAP